MTQPALYWRTKYGSLCERQAGPDRKGWMTVRRLSDGALRGVLLSLVLLLIPPMWLAGRVLDVCKGRA